MVSDKVTLQHTYIFQFGRLSFFKSAVYRGSLCKFLSKGSTFV